MEKRILVVGSLNMDQSIRVEAIPKTGETVLGSQMTFSPGGKGANQACAVARLGGNATMLGCVGADQFGEAQRENLSNAGVDVSHLHTTKDQATGTAVIYVNGEGDNCIVVAGGANQECSVEYIRENDGLLQDCFAVLLQMEIPYETVFYTLRRAAELGKTVVLNPAPAPSALPDDVYSSITYLTPNETELQKLTGTVCETLEELADAAQLLLGKGVKNVLVTIGSQGVLLVNGDGAVVYPTTDKKPVDTTAAGDTMNGAFLVALAEGKTIEEALRFGNMASSIAITRKGAQASIPTRSETDEAIRQFHPILRRIR